MIVGTVTRLAGSGTGGYVDAPATSAQFQNPRGVAVYGGIAYLIENGKYYIRQLSAGKSHSILSTEMQTFPLSHLH